MTPAITRPVRHVIDRVASHRIDPTMELAAPHPLDPGTAPAIVPPTASAIIPPTASAIVPAAALAIVPAAALASRPADPPVVPTARVRGVSFADYLAFTRPRSIPVTLAMVMTGWLASRSHARLSDILYLAIVYSFLLWGGSNAFNSAEDRDDGPVNLLPSPPPVPVKLGAFGIALMALAIGASVMRDVRCVALVAIAAVLSVFYSWRGAPWPRGKDIPGVDNLINAGGCGLGSFLLGWCTSGAPLTSGALYLGVAWTVCLFGGMPTAQIFQLRPDERRTNWTSWLGASRTLRLGAVLFAVHFVLIARVTTLGPASIIWGTGVLAAIVHSAWWSRDPFTHPYPRMLRQMTMLTIAQLAWAVDAS